MHQWEPDQFDPIQSDVDQCFILSDFDLKLKTMVRPNIDQIQSGLTIVTSFPGPWFNQARCYGFT